MLCVCSCVVMLLKDRTKLVRASIEAFQLFKDIKDVKDITIKSICLIHTHVFKLLLLQPFAILRQPQDAFRPQQSTVPEPLFSESILSAMRPAMGLGYGSWVWVQPCGATKWRGKFVQICTDICDLSPRLMFCLFCQRGNSIHTSQTAIRCPILPAILQVKYYSLLPIA